MNTEREIIKQKLTEAVTECFFGSLMNKRMEHRKSRALASIEYCTRSSDELLFVWNRLMNMQSGFLMAQKIQICKSLLLSRIVFSMISGLVWDKNSVKE